MDPKEQNDALKLLRELPAPAWWRSAWSVPPRHLRLRDWCEKHVKVIKSSRPGDFRLETNPIQGPVMDVMEHPEVREVGLSALIRTARKFNPDLGFKFSTYACQAIERSLWRVRVKAYHQRQRERGDGDMNAIRAVDHRQPGDELQLADTLLALERARVDLEPRMREILVMRFQGKMKLHEIGAVVGLTKERVRQVTLKGLAELKPAVDGERRAKRRQRV